MIRIDSSGPTGMPGRCCFRDSPFEQHTLPQVRSKPVPGQGQKRESSLAQPVKVLRARLPRERQDHNKRPVFFSI